VLAGVDRDKFAALRGARRVWAVGAIHGELDRLIALHKQLGDRFLSGDRLVYLGNYMGRGQAVLETIDALLLFRRQLIAAPGMHVCDVVYLRGQQEEMWHKLLQLHLAVGPAEVLIWMLEQGLRETLTAYGGDAETALRRARSGALELARWTNELRQHMQARDGHVQLMSSLRRAALSDDGALLFVHAGIDARRPLDAQGDAFWWNSADFAALDAPFAGYARIVRGFDPEHGGVRIGAFSATVDSGCGFGGPLTAVCFGPDGEEIERIEA
jgi:serine/threonine protein phosphatase 1